MKMIISDNAKFAIGDIFHYLSNVSNQYASEMINNIYKTILDIQDNPYIGRYVSELPYKKFRERICKEYRIIYYVSELKDTIYIRYIFSGKQNSNLFFKIHKNEIIKFLNQFFS